MGGKSLIGRLIQMWNIIRTYFIFSRFQFLVTTLTILLLSSFISFFVFQFTNNKKKCRREKWRYLKSIRSTTRSSDEWGTTIIILTVLSTSMEHSAMNQPTGIQRVEFKLWEKLYTLFPLAGKSRQEIIKI